jgi:hypothetical protein
MKKVLAVLIVLACLFIASSTMAAGYKMPKTLCLDLDDSAEFHQLSFKSIGSINDGDDGKITTYQLIASTNENGGGPLSGGAYLRPGSASLHATYSGMLGFNSRIIVFYELFFDLANGYGTLQYRYSGGSTNNGSKRVDITDCTMMDVVGSYEDKNGTTSVE